LATSEIDLLMLYTEFRASPAGQDIGMYQFSRMPLKLVYEIVRLAGDRDKKWANIYSISIARLSGIVISVAKGFSGDKSPIPELDQFLPYPLDQESNEFIAETKLVYKGLLAKQVLPLHVIAALNKVITV
jgi:hypothetical protein